MQQRSPLKDRAQGRWREILPALGVDHRLLTGKHCPCPICGGKDRFRFDNKDGRGTWICNHCEAGDGIGLVMKLKGLDFVGAAQEIEKVIGTGAVPNAKHAADLPAPPDDAAKFWQAQAYWRAGVRIVVGDPVDRYLKGRLGRYQPTRAVKTIAETQFAGRRLPAMVSAYVDMYGDLAGVQRTFLTNDGRKALGLDRDRDNTGSLPDGGAVRLSGLPTGRILGIAEGVETSLSAALMFNLPVWAALNANRLKVWQPPEGVTEIVVFGDNDINSVGQASAYALAERLIREGKSVQVMIPPEPGTDWNDALRAREGEQA